MCGPSTPHSLKLAGFMFTTIGFGIAALDCLCFAASVCKPVYDLSIPIRMHDSCNCLKYIIANGVNVFCFFLLAVGGGGLYREMEGF